MSDRATYPESTDARWANLEWQIIAPQVLVPAMNMAIDEVLTDRVGRGEMKPTLRFWGWSAPCVVLGRFQSVRNEVRPEALAEHDVALVRRISGGGAMFIQPSGAITWSIHVPESFVEGLSFAESYSFLDSWVVRGLRDLGIDAWYAPLNDITSAAGKIGGAAQARRTGAVLHHTTIAYDMDTDVLVDVLRVGEEKLSDKGTRSAAKRVDPLKRMTGMTREALIEAMSARFRSLTGARPADIPADAVAAAERRVAEQFATDDWIYLLP